MVVMVMTMVAVNSMGGTNDTIFADLKYGDDHTTVSNKMADVGFKYDNSETLKGGIVIDTYYGEFFSHRTALSAIYLNKVMVKAVVQLLTPDDDCIDTYNTVGVALMGKYGDADLRNDLEYINKNTASNRMAIREGSASPSLGWTDAGIAAFVNPNLSVSIAYESKLWDEHCNKRSSKNKSML